MASYRGDGKHCTYVGLGIASNKTNKIKQVVQLPTAAPVLQTPPVKTESANVVKASKATDSTAPVSLQNIKGCRASGRMQMRDVICVMRRVAPPGDWLVINISSSD